MSIAMRMPVLVHPPVAQSVAAQIARPRRRSAWHRLGWTGVEAAIFLAVLAFNLLGDGLRDALDPRLPQL